MKIKLSELRQIIKEEMHYDAVTSESQAPHKAKAALNFMKQHSPGDDAVLRKVDGEWKIRVTEVWTKDGETHSERVTIEPTLKAARDWLGY